VGALLARPRVVDATIAGLLLTVGMAAPYAFHRRAALTSLALVLVYSAIGYAASQA
jgi:hypothetical protein